METRGYAQDTVSSPLDGLLHIAVIKDDGRRLSAKLEGDLLEITLRSSRHNFTSRDGAARKRNFVDVLVSSKGCASDRAERRHGIHNAGRESARSKSVPPHARVDFAHTQLPRRARTVSRAWV